MDALKVTQTAIALSLKVANIILHSVGIFILRCLQKNDRGDVQMIYIVNLSFVELTINVTSFLRNVLKILPFNFLRTSSFKSIIMHSYILDYTILKLCLYTTLIVITLDRVFLIILGVFYPLYWNTRRAKILVGAVWGLSMSVFSAATIWYNSDLSNTIARATETYKVYSNESDFQNKIVATSTRNVANKFFLAANFVTVSLDFMFITIAFITYGLIFHKLHESHQRRYKGWRPELRRNSSLWGVFRESRFYSALLLIITFVLFVIPCDLTWAYYSLKRAPNFVGVLTTTSYAISYLSDGLIYIFMNDNVKTLLQRKVKNTRRSSAVSINSYLQAKRVSVTSMGAGIKKGFTLRITNRLRKFWLGKSDKY